MRWPVVAALLCLGAGAGVVHAEPLTPTERVRALLMTHHGPATRAVLERANPDAEAVVRRVAADRKAPAMVRKNALTALSEWPDDATFATWAEALAEPGDGLYKHRVLLLMGGTFGVRALPRLRPFLWHAQPAFQLTAVQAIAAVPGGQSGKALRARLADDPPAVVRAAIEARFARAAQPGAVVR